MHFSSEFLNIDSDEIELLLENNIYDLHNSAEFQGFNYNVKERNLTLEWAYFNDDESKSKIIFIFTSVSNFYVSSRDSEMPFSEDDCLDNMRYDTKSEFFIFKFWGGQLIKVKADLVNVKILPIQVSNL